MEQFGYVCSPLCKAKAEARKISVPVYGGQKWIVEANYWQKIGRIFGAIAAVVAVVVGVWFWYAWFGSVPHPVFSVRCPDAAFTGQSRLCGKNWIVFMHGNTLARYDLKTKKEIWSCQMIDPQLIKDAVAKASGNADIIAALGSTSMDLNQFIEKEMESGMQLLIEGSNVWVSAPEKLTHYDWDSGKVLQEIPLADSFGGIVSQGSELLLNGENDVGQQLITHINPATGESRTEAFGTPVTNQVAAARAPGARAAVARNAAGSPGAGLPLKPGADAGKPMDPGKVAAQAQKMPLPARIALPALLANSAHQEQIMREADDESDDDSPMRRQSGAFRPDGNLRSEGRFSLIPSQYGYVQFSRRLLESRMVTRDAMKAAPAKSVLDSGNLNASKTADVANEQLNEMQRNRGGNTVTEDESRYQVAIRNPDSTAEADWTGEVAGPPALIPLKTVNVLTAGKTVIVFDKANKKLWQATLAYSVITGAGDFSESAFGRENTKFGEGPCVERGDTLYIFDQAVLTAFDLATGNARWRLPSVGIAGLFFDDQGMLYVNTTTASPENIKYSREIDINQRTDTVFLKINPHTGKILWTANPGNFVSYLSGKFIYTYYIKEAHEDMGLTDLAGLTPTPGFIRIRRINPANGQLMWDYQQLRAPIDVQFTGNMIQLIFKKEVQVLKFLSF